MLRSILIMIQLLFINFLLLAQITFPFPHFPETDIERYLPENIKKITCYQGKKLNFIKEFNQEGKVIFSQWRSYYYSKRDAADLVNISGYVYNDNGLLVKEYSLHSNVGISHWFYEYDSLERKIKSTYYSYQYENHLDLINTNAYMFIADIKSMDNLLGHSTIMEMEQQSKYYSTTDYLYDDQGNLSLEIYFNEEGAQSYMCYEYDDNNNMVHYLTWSADSNDTLEIFQEYRKPIYYPSFYEDDTLRPPPPPPVLKVNAKKYNCFLLNEPEKPTLIQSIWVKYDTAVNNKRITRIIHYTYDFRNLVEIREYENGEFQSYYHFKYNCCNQVIQKDYVWVNINNPPNSTFYKYDKRCFVKQIKQIDYNGKEKIKFSYKFEFYDK